MSETVVYRTIRRPDPALVEALKGIAVADLHDELHATDRKVRLFGATMRPVIEGMTIVGPAVTAFNSPGDNLMMHTALYYARPGDVLVLSNGGVASGSLWGENASIQARRNGVAGVIADGPVRDLDGIRRQGVPVWATSITPSRPTKSLPGSVNVPVSCCGVIVHPGDLVVADTDGVIVVPEGEALRVAAAARARVARDRAMHEAMERGSTLYQEIGCDKSLEKLGAVVHDGPWTPR